MMKEYKITMLITEEAEQRLHQLAALRNRAFPDFRAFDVGAMLEAVATAGVVPELERKIDFWMKVYENEIERKEGQPSSARCAGTFPQGKAFGENAEDIKGGGAE